MVDFNLTFGYDISIEQRVVFEVAARILSTYLTDNTAVDVHILGASRLNDGQAVGGAVPLFHKVHYGVLKEYLEQDSSSYIDEQSVLHLQDGNTVDFSAYGEVINSNTEILLTKAQAEAIGMDESLLLADGAKWDRDVVQSTGLDGYIVVNQDFEWNTDVLRLEEPTEGTLDLLSMAIHELVHVMGFVSGIDGTIDINQLLSDELQVEGATLFDLMRYTETSAATENPDGSVSSITEGEAAYLSADGGETSIGDLSTGQGGDGYQASHWKRMQVAMGIMDPTLAYKEQLTLAERDLQALDLLGWDVDYSQLETELDMEALLIEAEQAVAQSLGLDSTVLTEHRSAGSVYTMGFSEWWQLFEKQIVEMGFSEWWQVLEAGYDTWEDFQADPNRIVEMGFSEWWQAFEATVLEMGFSEWWQTFEADMLQMGFSEWWQLLEMGFSEWWQQLETYFATLEDTAGQDFFGESEQFTKEGTETTTGVVTSGGAQDDILAGSTGRDLISGGGGDDLIDGKAGNDILLGDDGNDLIYGLTGDDQIYGGDGNDFISGEADNDKLYGEAGADIISGGHGNDLLQGGAGRDALKGDGGKDLLEGGTGDDSLEGGDDNDILVGGQGRDIADGGRGDDIIYGDDFQAVSSTNTNSNTNTDTDSQSANTTQTTTPNTDTSNTSTSNTSLLAFANEVGIVESADTPLDFWVRLEAEDFRTRNFNEESTETASGGSLISTGGRGSAKTEFTGPAGVYDLVVGYYAGSNLESELELKIKEPGRGKREEQKYEWVASQNIESSTDNDDGFITYTIKSVKLSSGSEIELRGNAENGDTIRLDYVDLAATSETNAIAGAEFYEGNLYLTTQSGSWESAQAEAEALGGRLVTIDSRQEQRWIERTFGKQEGFWVEDDGDGNKRLGNANSSELRGIIEISASGNKANLVQDKTIESFNNKLRIEAEGMTLSGGYEVETRDDYTSGEGVIKAVSEEIGNASTVFTGNSGIYNIFVNYLDEGSGQSNASVKVNGQTIDSWQFNQDNNSSKYRVSGREVTLNTGDVIEVEGRSHAGEQAIIDYIELQQLNYLDESSETFLFSDARDDSSNRLRLEAEEMNLSGEYKIEEKDFASGTGFVAAEDDFAARAIFTGETGRYNIVAGYYDTKGNGELTAKIDGVELGSWQHTQDAGDSAEEKTFVTRVIKSDILLNEGATIELEGLRDDKDKIFFDYLEFVKYDPNASIILEAEDMTASGDFEYKEYDFASGGKVLKAKSEDLQKSLKLNSTFTGASGTYDVEIGYYDGNEGIAQMLASVGGVEIDSWLLDQDLGVKEVALENFATRRIEGVMLNTGDIFKLESRREDNDYGFIDYIKFTPEHAESFLTDVRVEAEHMSLSGKVSVKDADFASGTGFVKTDSDDPGFTATTLFMGETGYYNIVVGYYDGNEGNAELSVKLNAERIDQWLLDEDFGDKDESIQTATTRTVATGVKLTHADDVIQILGIKDGEDQAAIDYIDFIAIDEPNLQSEPVDSGLGAHNDVLRGGAGNDTIYGGKGDDVIYGEDDDDILYGDSPNEATVTVWNPETLSFQQNVDGYAGTSDTYVSQYYWNYGGFGNYARVSTDLAYGNYGELGETIGLLKFDDIFGQETGQIKSDSVIHSATLELNILNIGDDFELYEMLHAWTETSTWNSLGSDMIASGIEPFTKLISTEKTSGTGILSIDVTESLQAWQADPTNNQGWGFVATGNDGVDFGSSESGYGPRLIVDVDSSSVVADPDSDTDSGDDYLSGGRGNDTLKGGLGSDILEGTDSSSYGTFEYDILGGSLGNDTFILGNQTQSYYLGGGDSDYARIVDFDAFTDVIQLHGTAAEYRRWQHSGNVHLLQGNDLVAIVEGQDSIDFDSSSVVFV